MKAKIKYPGTNVWVDYAINAKALNGDDQIQVDVGNTGSIWGLGGNDTIWGAAGADDLRGGIGQDRLLGRDGNDTLMGRTATTVFMATMAMTDYLAAAAPTTSKGGVASTRCMVASGTIPWSAVISVINYTAMQEMICLYLKTL